MTGAVHAARFDPFPVARARTLGLLDAPPPLLVVTDFDGTLAPISPEPMGARIEPLGRTALRRLARIADRSPDRLRLAVLSGRSALDVAGRVRVGGLRYLGVHGLEGGSLGARRRPERLEVAVDEGLVGLVGPVRRLADAVAARLAEPWLFVEIKGPSAAFHYRAAPDPEAARARVLAAIDAAEADLAQNTAGAGAMPLFVRFEGRRVVELRPPGVGGKDAAVERLIDRERPGAVLVLGDDRSDAEAFEVVARERSAGRLAGLAVAVHGSVETPPEVVAAADVLLPSPRAAARLLSALGRELERRPT